MEKKCKALTIAVDGYSSTGKSTVAKIVAAQLGYSYIDTGAMYRAVTLEAMRQKLINAGQVDLKGLELHLSSVKIEFRYNRETKVNETWLKGECVEKEIRGMEVSGNVSLIASIGFVRRFLVEQQRDMRKSGGVVMDGRDIGSVVFPDAEVKFFMTASPEVRAMRRYNELIAKGDTVSYAEVEKNVRERDYIDSHREESPLIQTADAILVDNSDMTVDEEVRFMLEKIDERR